MLKAKISVPVAIHCTAHPKLSPPPHIMFWVILVPAMLQILTVSILEQSDLIKRHSLISVTDVIQSHLLHFIFANNMFQIKMKKSEGNKASTDLDHCKPEYYRHPPT
jgi:hypothetical protein